MLLIWGFKGRYKTITTGTFYCPHEGGDRPYRHQKVDRWFTFFFIPIFPTKTLGEFIECTSCGSNYDMAVLTMPTAAAMMDNLANAMRYAAVAIIKADMEISPEEKDFALQVMERFSDTPYTREDLERDLLELQPEGLSDAFSRVAGTLNEHGKESLVVACVGLSAADGEIAQSELREITKAAEALNMSPAHLRGIIASAVDAMPPRD